MGRRKHQQGASHHDPHHPRRHRGELERRTVGNETEIKAAVVELINATEYFNPGDTIKIVEEE